MKAADHRSTAFILKVFICELASAEIESITEYYLRLRTALGEGVEE